jgi:hypothetical protein
VTDNNRNIPEESQLGIPDRLAEDVRALLEPELSVPAEIDRAVLDRASRHFAGREFVQARRRFRWVALWKVAAAAAVVIFAFSLDLHDKPQRAVHDPAMAGAGAVDFDRDGQVNILDAFKLARQIELAGGTKANLDINGDGLVNRDDVDKIAFAAVSLTPAKRGPGKGVL